MELWQALNFAVALLAVVGVIAHILCSLHFIERAEQQEWKKQFKERIEAIR